MNRCSKITDEGFTKLARGLNNLNDLKNLHLLFGECSEISDQGVNMIAENVESLALLKKIHLDFSK